MKEMESVPTHRCHVHAVLLCLVCLFDLACFFLSFFLLISHLKTCMTMWPCIYVEVHGIISKPIAIQKRFYRFAAFSVAQLVDHMPRMQVDRSRVQIPAANPRRKSPPLCQLVFEITSWCICTCFLSHVYIYIAVSSTEIC